MTCSAELEYLQARAKSFGLIVSFYRDKQTGSIEDVYIQNGPKDAITKHDPLTAAELLRGVLTRKGVPSWRSHCEQQLKESEQTVKTRW